jgi:hypothetical protein
VSVVRVGFGCQLISFMYRVTRSAPVLGKLSKKSRLSPPVFVKDARNLLEDIQVCLFASH